MNLSIETLNGLSTAEAERAFAQCCSASRWIRQMAQARPYESVAHCQELALEKWAALDEADYLEAFEGHPKIGDVNSLRKKYANTKALASGEQSAVQQADDTTLQALAKGNEQYEQQNGFIFIVCATGKSAAEMLVLLEARLRNNRDTELSNAAAEQAKISALRIDKLFQRTQP